MKNTKTIFITSALALSFVFASFRFMSMKWTVDAANAKVHFSMPKGKHEGTFGGLVSTVDFDMDHPELASIKATVDVNTVNTGIDHLNEHLKSPDFFDAAKHPVITFTAESVAKTDSGFVAKGKLAMRDSIKDISIPFKFTKDEKGNAMMTGKMDIYSGDYGVGQKSAAGNDEVVIDLEVPLTGQK